MIAVNRKKRSDVWLWLRMAIVVALALSYLARATSVNAEGVEGEDGAIKQHDLFEFEAFIKHSDILDGTAPFDKNDEPGNDSDAKNRIVRSWDTVTYPLKVTINPKKVDKLEKIKLKISGELENGITDDRVNARFAVGDNTDLQKGKVQFVQEYTVEQTGNSVMIPVTLEIQAAKHGVKLTPKISVEVVSVDGKKITGVKTDLHSLPSVTTSAKVSIKPYVSKGMTGTGIPIYPYQGVTGNEDDMENIHSFSVAWGIDKLPGKSNIRGATFPDSDATIEYNVDMSGYMHWQQGPNRGEYVDLNFHQDDTPFMIFDQRSNTTVHQVIGAANTLSDGTSYSFIYHKENSAPYSDMSKHDAGTIEKLKKNHVWGSGSWELSAPVTKAHQVSYTGTNTGYIIGNTFPEYRGYNTADSYFGVNDKLFSSRLFLVLMPNEYRIGGPNNPDGHANTVYYRADVTLKSYTDADGNKVTFNKKGSATFSEVNNPDGSYSYLNDYVSYRGGEQLGTYWANHGSISKGDASTLIGEDVIFRSRIQSDIPFLGGYRMLYRWNTDAFELTKDYAASAERSIYNEGYYNYALKRVQNNKETQDVSYGVPNFTDNSFDLFKNRGIDDYAWYDTYAEAIKHGPVGAMQSHVTASVGANKYPTVHIPLHVKHDNIGLGSHTKDGSAIVSFTTPYGYIDKDRKVMVDLTKNLMPGNPAIWDENGVMLKMQSPHGVRSNFETLAIVPAEVGSDLTSEKTTYYNSETIRWTAKNSIKLPDSGVPDNLDAGVTITHTLPKGLNYKVDSGKIGSVATDPEIFAQPNGETLLVWNLLVSNKSSTLETITFDTTINPFALVADSVQSSIAVKSVVSSDLDKRPESFRTSTTPVTILKVGMVGIYESINKSYGDKNSDYIVTLSPYTTIEDEEGVTGLTHLPLSGDTLGSEYSGAAEFKAINLSDERVHNDKPILVYLNKEPIYSDRPHEVDVTKDGWYRYTGNPEELDGAVSLLFRVEGKMTNKDNIKLNLTVQTENNEFGDQYLNETVINSDTDYRLSPVSNRVRYLIRADLELKLERFQIYTNKADNGLPTSTRVGQTVLEPEKVKDAEITLAIYDTDSGNKVTEKTYKQHELSRENAILIPPDVLKKADKKNFEVRIEGYDENKIWVRSGEGAIDTDGYTAQEGTLTVDDADENGDVTFKGVVMTEREFGKDMAVFYETWNMKKINEPVTKSGYGYTFSPKLLYSNDMLNDVRSRISDVVFSPEVSAFVDHRLIDQSLEYYDSEADYGDDGKVEIKFLRSESTSANTLESSYQLPQLYLEQGTGLTYTGNQKENGQLKGLPIDAGHKLYVPVWIDSVGLYDVFIRNKKPIGSNFMNVDLLRHVNVEAYMFNHTDSETPEIDELLIHPIRQEEIPEDW